MLLDGEKECSKRAHYQDIIDRVDYLKCSENFPTYWTNKQDLLEAMNDLMIQSLVKRQFVITTLGANGSVMLKRGTSTSGLPTVSSFADIESKLPEWRELDKVIHLVYKPSFDVEPSVILYCPPYKKISNQIVDTTGLHSSSSHLSNFRSWRCTLW